MVGAHPLLPDDYTQSKNEWPPRKLHGSCLMKANDVIITALEQNNDTLMVVYFHNNPA